MQYISAGIRSKGISIESSGANFAYRLSAYSAIGGYDPTHTVGEDVYLGRMLRGLVKSSDDRPTGGIKYAGGGTRLYTSPRRTLDALKNGYSAIEQWSYRNFGDSDDLRTVEPMKAESINYDDPADVRLLLNRIQNQINRTVQHARYWGVSDINTYVDRAIRFLGVEYTSDEDSNITITNAEKLISDLKSTKETNRL